MTEDDARGWLVETLGVSRETMRRIDTFVALLTTANERQNLISASTIASIWSRHIADSAQLVLHAAASGRWVDIGTGAGFPGLIVALLGGRDVTLVENRPLRAQFLESAIESLEVANVAVLRASAASIDLPAADVISARAVAPLDRLFAMAAHLADDRTTWLLPKGRQAASELAATRESWQGAFTMQPSITDPDAAIIVARDIVRRRARESRG